MPDQSDLASQTQDTSITPTQVLEACYCLCDTTIGVERIRPLCVRIAAGLTWTKRSKQVIADLEEWTQACLSRNRTEEEDAVYLYLAVMHIAGLHELYSGSYYKDRPSEQVHCEQAGSVAAAFKALLQTFGERREDLSPQAKYGEAQLRARLALGESQDGTLGGFKKIVTFLKEQSSSRVHQYTSEEVGLRLEDFLDAVERLAHGETAPADIPNPPAHLRISVRLEKRRRERKSRKEMLVRPREIEDRSNTDEEPRILKRGPLAGDRSLRTPSEVMVSIDLERASLSSDQMTLIEAQMHGLGLQESGAAEELGWSPKRLDRVRHSLLPSRKTGKRLRERLAAYATPVSDQTN
jgi:hypothetical protein